MLFNIVFNDFSSYTSPTVPIYPPSLQNSLPQSSFLVSGKSLKICLAVILFIICITRDGANFGSDPGEPEAIATIKRPAGQKPLRILIAEDNPSNQKVLIEMLKRLGYRADGVADGREAVQSLERQDYDLVLMDIKMPEMDGITAAKEIRKLRPVSSPKIVAITAYALEGDREMCLEAGMDDYIAKPVKMNELAGILEKYSA